ncbi:hypothetical protein [Roseibium polysiphoniae]|uniref:hypothetical protein n=1 Tax=Roseibium polysiphoniae TaxID=2571221 RepID=UPI0025934148|nr:hypothetical protein [uncultured Roseibium sp.]
MFDPYKQGTPSATLGGVTMSAQLQAQIEKAGKFFAGPAGPLKAEELVAAPTKTPELFQADGNTTGSVMQFNGTLPDSVSAADKKAFQTLLTQQQYYLQSGLGLVTAWMSNNFQRQPDKWADPNNWQAPLSVLPAEFYTPTDITSYHYEEHFKGVEIATSFLTSMVAWAAGAAIAPAFTNFLTSMGDQIRAGVKSKSKEMNTYHLSFGYQPIQNSAGNWELMTLAEYYFIHFTEKEKTVYSTCASAEVFDFDFKYQKGTLLLNWASMSNPAQKDNKKAWDDVITGSTKDDVEKAKNFFGHDVAKKS